MFTGHGIHPLRCNSRLVTEQTVVLKAVELASVNIYTEKANIKAKEAPGLANIYLAGQGTENLTPS